MRQKQNYVGRKKRGALRGQHYCSNMWPNDSIKPITVKIKRLDSLYVLQIRMNIRMRDQGWSSVPHWAVFYDSIEATKL